MSHVIINADFSGCNVEDRVEFCNQLAAWHWVKMQADAADNNTVWMAELSSGITQDDAVNLAKSKFYSCCKPNCEPKAAFEYGYNEAGLISLYI